MARETSLVPIRKLVRSTDHTQYPHGESNVWTLMRHFRVLWGISTQPISRKITNLAKIALGKAKNAPEYGNSVFEVVVG